jgi:hypothetical protein
MVAAFHRLIRYDLIGFPPVLPERAQVTVTDVGVMFENVGLPGGDGFAMSPQRILK